MSQTNITVKVHSAGYSYGNSALITLNDREIGFDNYSRGLNVAVFNESSGQNISCTTFDTYAEGNSDSFALFVENLPLSRIVAIAVKDEASRNLSERAKRACESLGSSLIHNLQYQGSWAMIGQKGAAPGTAEESLSNDSSATASRSIAVESVSAKSPTISATSAGGNHGNMAQITMNGNIVSIEGGYQRGLNVVIFDESNGNQLISQSFNLLGKASEAEAFAKLIEDLPVGRVVAIAVKDEASINLSERAKRACESIGSRMIHSLKFRCSWAIVGYKGASPGSVIENLNNSGPFYNSGPVSVKFWMSSIIPPNGEDTVVHLKTRRGGEGERGRGGEGETERRGDGETGRQGDGNWKEKQKLQPSDLQRGDHFGNSVAISEEVAIVGANEVDVQGRLNAGSAYIFQLENGVWKEKQKLQPSDLRLGDQFGNSVAISGKVLIVGAWLADAQGSPDSGSAYIFQLEKGVWKEKQKLQPSDLHQGDWFGVSVAISGEVAIVGAYKADAQSSPDTGSAYIFQLEKGVWKEKQKLQPSDLQRGDYFGVSVAISGEVAIVGAARANAQGSPDTGSAYIFQLEKGVWKEKQKLQPSDLHQGDWFGYSVAISGDVAIVGAYKADAQDSPDAGSAYIFQLEKGVWKEKQKLQPSNLHQGDWFGYSVAISEEVVIVGAYKADAQDSPDAGIVYIFQLEKGVWKEKQKLQPSDLQQGDNFGWSVAISGKVAIMGAAWADVQGSPDTGSAYIFERGVT